MSLDEKWLKIVPDGMKYEPHVYHKHPARLRRIEARSILANIPHDEDRTEEYEAMLCLVLDAIPRAGLSSRDEAIVRMTLAGKSGVEVARAISIAPETVSRYKKRAIVKIRRAILSIDACMGDREESPIDRPGSASPGKQK